MFCYSQHLHAALYFGAIMWLAHHSCKLKWCQWWLLWPTLCCNHPLRVVLASKRSQSAAYSGFAPTISWDSHLTYIGSTWPREPLMFRGTPPTISLLHAIGQYKYIAQKPESNPLAPEFQQIPLSVEMENFKISYVGHSVPHTLVLPSALYLYQTQFSASVLLAYSLAIIHALLSQHYVSILSLTEVSTLLMDFIFYY